MGGGGVPPSPDIWRYFNQGGIHAPQCSETTTSTTTTSKCCIFIATPVVIFVVDYLKDIQTELVAKETRERLCFFDSATLIWVRR